MLKAFTSSTEGDLHNTKKKKCLLAYSLPDFWEKSFTLIILLALKADRSLRIKANSLFAPINHRHKTLTQSTCEISAGFQKDIFNNTSQNETSLFIPTCHFTLSRAAFCFPFLMLNKSEVHAPSLGRRQRFSRMCNSRMYRQRKTEQPSPTLTNFLCLIKKYNSTLTALDSYQHVNQLQDLPWDL